MIEFRDVRLKSHNLELINFKISKGEMVVLDGKSGAGKSSILNILSLLLHVDSGEVFFNGENILSYLDYHASEFRSKILGYAPQDATLFDELSVKENLLVPLVIKDFSKDEIEQKIDRALKIINIDHKKYDLVKNLSTGEKQRVLIARAVTDERDVVLFDEPTSNLDDVNALQFAELLGGLKKQGKTILIATHDARVANLDVIDKMLHLRDGKIE